jgi:hypothetical protein
MRYQPPVLHRRRARQMRLDATRPEAKLWDALRGRQLLTNIDGVCLTILAELRNTGEGL